MTKVAKAIIIKFSGQKYFLTYHRYFEAAISASAAIPNSPVANHSSEAPVSNAKVITKFARKIFSSHPGADRS